MNTLILNEDKFGGIKSVVPFFAEKEEKGIAKITRFEFKNNHLFNFIAMREDPIFIMYEGHYCQLKINGKIMMSDTPMERKSNREFIKNANGRVLIAGLGIGMIIHNIIDNPNVSEIVVIEKYQDVIDLVEPKFKHPKLKVICADIFEWKPTNVEKFDTIYFDIWADITTDNLEQIKTLHNRFKNSINRLNPTKWMNSWMKEYLQKKQIQEKREYRY